MEELFIYLEKNKSRAAVSALVAVMVVVGLFSYRQGAGSWGAPEAPTLWCNPQTGACNPRLAGVAQPPPRRNYPCFQQPGAGPYGQAQLAATLALSMGVTLGGKGTVLSVEPGSAAQLAGIQAGDVINRINGR